MNVARITITIGAIALFSTSAIANAHASDRENPSRERSPNSNGRVAWMKNLDQARRISVETGRPMLIVVGAKWCGFCHKLENTTLSDQAMVEYIHANFIPVHLDADRDRKAVRGLKAKTLPATIVLSPDRKVLARLIGYRDAEDFHDELEKSLQRYDDLTQQ